MKKNFLYQRLSMNGKIFAITTCILFSSILITGAFVQNHLRSLYSESINQAVQLTMQKYSAIVADGFYRTEVLGNMIQAEIPSLFPELEERADVFETYRTYLQLEKKMGIFCEGTFGKSSDYRCYLLLNSELPMTAMFRAPDSIFSYSNYVLHSFFILSDEALRGQDWMQTAKGLGSSNYWFSFPADSGSIYCARNLNHTFMVNGIAMNYELGTLVVRMDMSEIAASFEGNVFGDNLNFLIIDHASRIVYTKDGTIMNRNFYDIIQAENVIPGDSTTEFTASLNGVSHRFCIEELPDNMQLISFLPTQTLRSRLWENLQLILLVFLVVLVAEVILTALFSRIITFPIRRLTSHIKDSPALTVIAHDYRNRDEIGILYHTFNEMVEKNEALIQQIYDYNEQQKKMKYQLLQAQINPHFLYNTLDSVSCAALINGEKELSDVLSFLALILRYSIHQPDQLVTLKEELKVAGDYIAIQQFRCDNQIRFTCEVSPEAAEIQLPKMILQPLLENGIRYGSAGEDGYRYVSIQVTLETVKKNDAGKSDSIVSIRVFNEHNLMELTLDEEVERLNRYLNGDCQLKRSGSGLGILNVQQRIQLAFGETYGIHYEGMGNQMAAVITLPFFV